MMNQIPVSVIIPAYNAEKTILKAIQAVLNQSYSNVELIVVDDGSTDKTADIVRSVDRARYVYQKNQGPASARNNGASKATGEIIFFTDSDCIPDPEWITVAVRHFADPKVAAVAGSYGINNPESLLARCIHKEIIFRHRFLMPKQVKSFGSYNVGIKKSVFQEVEGFDTGFVNASGEDNDLSYKILHKNHIICFEPKALVGHFHPSSIKKYLFEQYRHGFWRAKLYQKHPKMLAGDDYTFWKDMVEVPISLILMAFLLFSLFYPIVFTYGLIGLLILFLCLESIFALVITQSIRESVFYTVVQILRSFARTIGFSFGIIYFTFKLDKKI